MMTDMREVCPNCNNSWIAGDQYCRFCGSPVANPQMIPAEMVCIYGPRPRSRMHQCEQCGYQWNTHAMVDRQAFCPKCGGSAPVVLEEER